MQTFDFDAFLAIASSRRHKPLEDHPHRNIPAPFLLERPRIKSRGSPPPRLLPPPPMAGVCSQPAPWDTTGCLREEVSLTDVQGPVLYAWTELLAPSRVLSPLLLLAIRLAHSSQNSPAQTLFWTWY